MPLPQLDEEIRTRRRQRFEIMGERNRSAELRARRDMWRDLAGTGVLCMVWCAVGLGLVGMAMHVVGDIGWVYFWAGLLVGNGGIVFTLARAYRRGADRGDW